MVIMEYQGNSQPSGKLSSIYPLLLPESSITLPRASSGRTSLPSGVVGHGDLEAFV